MTPATPAAPQSREIRVFLSSTFHDFMEERDLLVKQVFPSLRRRAQERGVEVVDVDLRWGITEEESQRGKVIGICLAEIERCRPYFIGMLGERYGWTPRADDYPDEVLEREELQWLKDYQGGVSLTELEILHGVLNDQEMAGRAFFYFRDPAWSRAQREPGFICDTAEEQAKLLALKDRIRASGFPVAEDLPEPKAIAERIEADLWMLIEEQFPERDQADALEREERKHASYRQSRLGVYLGQDYVDQLEALVSSGEQTILITGESGLGKSALIANWMERHAQIHPADLVYAHHLGCTNDSNVTRPLLGRMLDTASKLLMGAELITEPIQVPQDWWELTAKVAETLQDLGRWCRKTGHRWIWVLDGLDRLDPDEQKALPWLPLNLPAGVQVVASALACPAREILSERGYITFTIQPLEKAEQEQLIQRYLQRYTKELDGGLRQQVLSHSLSGSPLFLKVLLEELRQCGRHDTIKEQLAFYLSAQTVDDLYERVLERLENDGCGEAVKKVMTALWASRAGLTESELLEITDLKQLQWAPIDLALEKAFGRNGNRLVFDHDYLRIAVQDRYLPTEEQRRQAHSVLTDWYQAREGWDERDSEELPWQLQEAGRLDDLRDLLLKPWALAHLQWNRGSRETINYWLVVKADHDGDLDELIAEAVEEEIEMRKEDPDDQFLFAYSIAALLDEAGLCRDLLLRLRCLSLALQESGDNQDVQLVLNCKSALANAYWGNGDLESASKLHEQCIAIREQLLGAEHSDTLNSINDLGALFLVKGDYERAETLLKRCLGACERLLGHDHPSTLICVNNLGCLYTHKGYYEKADFYCALCLEAFDRLLGAEHPSTIAAVGNLADLFLAKGDYEQAEVYYKRCLEARERLLGLEHPSTLITVGDMGLLYCRNGQYDQSEAFYKRCLIARERLLGAEHPDTLATVGNLGLLYQAKSDYEQAEACYNRCLEASERLLGSEHPSTLAIVGNLGLLYSNKGDYNQAEAYYKRDLEASERLLGPKHPSTLITVNNLGLLYSDKGDYEQAEACYNRCLEAQERLLGPEHPDTLTTVGNLAGLFQDKGAYEQAEAYYTRCLEARERLLGPDHPDTNNTRFSLANLLSDQERYDESIPLRRQELDVAAKRDGREAPGTLTSIHCLAQDLYWADELEESEQLYREALAGRIAALGDDDGATMASRYGLARCLSEQERYSEAIVLRRVELAWCQASDDVDAKNMLISMHGLGCDLLAADETDEALEVLQSCLSQRQKELSACDDATLGTLARVLEALSSLDRQREGLVLSRATQESLVAELGESHPKVLTQLSNQADLHDELGELEQAEALYRRCLTGREEALGPEHHDTLSTAYSLADVLSQLERRSEAIPLRRRELAWCRQQNGDTDPGTLTSINALAIDLRETGELEEAEALFRELLVARQQVLEPSDFGIGRALGGLAKTLEEVSKLEEAAAYARQALDHRLEHQGPDDFSTNVARLDLARILHKLGRVAEANTLLDQLEKSMDSMDAPDDADRQLQEEAFALRSQIQSGP